MIKKLSRYGNSSAVLIDKPILELLNITQDTLLKISTDGTKIFIEPLSAEAAREHERNHPQVAKKSAHQPEHKPFNSSHE